MSHKLGHIVSKETRIKIGLAHKGKFVSKETRKKQRDSHLGHKLSEETKVKISKSHIKSGANIGEKNGNWKGGVSTFQQRLRKIFRYRQWRSDIFQRDDYACQECGIRSGNGKAVYLEAHHIKEFSKILEEYQIKTIEQALDCEELWCLDNGITLCFNCHNKTKKGGSTLKPRAF
jgi:hypothetical protein